MTEVLAAHQQYRSIISSKRHNLIERDFIDGMKRKLEDLKAKKNLRSLLIDHGDKLNMPTISSREKASPLTRVVHAVLNSKKMQDERRKKEAEYSGAHARRLQLETREVAAAHEMIKNNMVRIDEEVKRMDVEFDKDERYKKRYHIKRAVLRPPRASQLEYSPLSQQVPQRQQPLLFRPAQSTVDSHLQRD